jgi:hypothetical protein
MESKKINQLATELAPDLTDITIIGDPTTGISKKITLSQMASLFTGTVEEYANLAAFPLVGVADTIYIALDTNVLYRWDTTLSAYVELSPNIINSLVFNDANGFDGTISLVGSVATLTMTTALTLGSVPYIGASGALTQSNANFFWDATNSRLGIATNAPTTKLDVFGSGIIGRLNATSTNNAFLGFASNGTNKWSAGNVQTDHRFRIYSEANSAELVSVLQTGEFGIGIANPLTKLHIFGGASALIANLDANTSVAKSISFRSGNSSRINLEVSGTESGSNAGMDFFLRTYTDAGSLLATPFQIVRSTSNAIFSGLITSTVGNNLEVIASQSATTGWVNLIRGVNTGANAVLFIENSTGGNRALGTLAYSTGLATFTNTALHLGTNNNVRFTITGTGNLGFGVTTPTQNTYGINRIFEIGGSSVPGIVLRTTSTTGEQSILTGGDGLIISSTGSASAATDNVIRFFTGASNSSYSATEKVRISSDGYLRLAGKGIQFNGDTSDVNSLDDYEEGTYTPTISTSGGTGSVTYQVQNGWYVKVGSLCYAYTWLVYRKGTLSGGSLSIGGLPFTSYNGGTHYPECTLLIDNLAATLYNPIVQLANNATSGDIIQNNGGTSNHAGLSIATYISPVGAGVDLQIRCTFIYRTN